MNRLKHTVDRRSLETIYTAYVRPILEYGSVIWDNCDEIDKKLLEDTQLDAARIITGAIRGTSHNEIYEEIGWETLETRRERQQLLLMHKMINGVAPTYLQNLIPSLSSQTHRYPTSNRHNLVKIKCESESYRNSFLPKTVKNWNLLPLETRNITDFQAFKNILKKSIPKANLLFYEGDRRNNIAHARLRMGCSKLNSHLYYNIHVVDSPKCSCGLAVESIDHYFFFCPLYLISRELMVTGINQLTGLPKKEITRKLLLYGNKRFSLDINTEIFKIVQRYINETERFDAKS